MSLRVALGVVGGVVGAFYGNPQLGYMIGSTLGSIVDPGTIKGPSIGDIANQTAQEGIPRPVVFGTSPPIAGNVIEQSDPRIVKKKSSAKGGPKVVTESVYRTYAVRVCEGPIGAYLRIWRNNVLVYDAREVPDLTAEENEAFLETARLYLGDFEQIASPDLETIFGVGTTPSHRGTAYLVMADEDLTELRGAIPQWTFQVSNIATTPRYGDLGVVRTIIQSPLGLDGQWTETWTCPAGVEEIALLLVGCGGECINGISGTLNEFFGTGGGGAGQVVYKPRISVSGDATGSLTRRGPNSVLDMFDTKFNTGLELHTALDAQKNPDGRGSAIVFTNLSPCTSTLYEAGAGFAGTNPGGSGGLARLIDSGGGPPVCAGQGGGGGGGGGPGFLDVPGDGRYLGSIFGDDIGDAGWFGGGGAGAKSIGAIGTPGGRGGGGPSVVLADAALGFGTNHTGGGAGAKRRTLGDGGSTTKGGTGIIVTLHYDPDVWGPGYWPDGAVLSDIVIAICARAGLPAQYLDTSEIDGIECRGITITNQYPAAEAIRALGQIFKFDASSRDGKLHFILRGGASVATITENDMVDDGADVSEPDHRLDPISVPRVLHLSYYDIAGGLATDKQTSTRAGDWRSVGEASLQTAVILNADEAAQAVVVNHKVLVETQKGTRKFSLSDKFIGLTTADPIVVQTGGTSRRMLIKDLQILDGEQAYECQYDRQSAYTSDVQGLPAAPQTPPPTSIVGPTLLVPLDIALLRDVDDAVGPAYYVAVAGLTPAWNGALVELSYDGGANYVDSQLAYNSATIGELVTELADHPQEYPDEVNTTKVRILTPDVDLEETDLDGMLDRINLAAIGDLNGSSPGGEPWELINFANADETVTEGEWDLSYFLRGRKATETQQHDVGSTFVLLERGILGFIPASITDIGRMMTFRATSIGAPQDSGTVVSIVFEAQVQRERPAAYLSAYRDGINAVISWQGVGRLGGGPSVLHGARFAGYRVTIDDGVNPVVSVDTPSEGLTYDVSGLGAGLTIQVCQLNDFTGEGPLIQVLLT